MGRQVAASVLAEPGLTPVGYVDGLAEPGVLEGLPLCEGDQVRAALFGSQHQDFVVLASQPAGAVLVHPGTQVVLQADAQKAAPTSEGAPPLAYEDIGGLRKEIRRVREMVELPAVS